MKNELIDKKINRMISDVGLDFYRSKAATKADIILCLMEHFGELVKKCEKNKITKLNEGLEDWIYFSIICYSSMLIAEMVGKQWEDIEKEVILQQQKYSGIDYVTNLLINIGELSKNLLNNSDSKEDNIKSSAIKVAAISRYMLQKSVLEDSDWQEYMSREE